MIVGTANHFIIDAVGGALVLAAGFGVQWLLSGRGAYAPPVDAPDFGMPDPPLPQGAAPEPLTTTRRRPPRRPGGRDGRPPVVVDELARVEAERVAQHPRDRDEFGALVGQLVARPCRGRA